MVPTIPETQYNHVDMNGIPASDYQDLSYAIELWPEIEDGFLYLDLEDLKIKVLADIDVEDEQYERIFLNKDSTKLLLPQRGELCTFSQACSLYAESRSFCFDNVRHPGQYLRDMGCDTDFREFQNQLIAERLENWFTERNLVIDFG